MSVLFFVVCLNYHIVIIIIIILHTSTNLNAVNSVNMQYALQFVQRIQSSSVYHSTLHSLFSIYSTPYSLHLLFFTIWYTGIFQNSLRAKQNLWHRVCVFLFYLFICKIKIQISNRDNPVIWVLKNSSTLFGTLEPNALFSLSKTVKDSIHITFVVIAIALNLLYIL